MTAPFLRRLSKAPWRNCSCVESARVKDAIAFQEPASELSMRDFGLVPPASM